MRFIFGGGKMTKFALLLEGIKEELDLPGLQLENVDIDCKKRYWILSFFLPEAIKSAKFKLLNEKIKEVLNQYEAKIYCNFRYDKINLEESEYLDYFRYIIESLTSYRPRYLALETCQLKFINKTYFLSVDEQSSFLMENEHKIIDQLRYTGLKCELSFDSEKKTETINDLIPEPKSEEYLIITDDKPFSPVTSSAPNKKPEYRSFRKAREINEEEIVKINVIPLTQIDLMEHENKTKNSYFTVQGTIFYQELRKMKNGSFLLMLKVTDGSDSIYVKKFMNTTDEELKSLKVGDYIVLVGKAQFDTYERDVIIMADNIRLKIKEENSAEDLTKEKRVELHAHTQLSNMDALPSVKDYFSRASKYGHEAIAFTDHGGVYAFPDIFKASKSYPDVKPIYGSEFDYVEENSAMIALNEKNIDLREATYCVFDLETTGFSVMYNKIIEVAAVKIHKGLPVENFSRLIKIDEKLTTKISDLTNISDEMLQTEGLDEETVIKEFYEFCQGTIMVGHNVNFDLDYIYHAFSRYNLEYKPMPAIDTIQLARVLYENDMKRFGLKYLCKFLKVTLDDHHRAHSDSKATSEALIIMLNELYAKEILTHDKVNALASFEKAHRYHFPTHITVLVKNQIGLKNLYRLISQSLTDEFHGGQRLKKSSLLKYREGLLIGSSCVNGLVFEKALNKSNEALEEAMEIFDYIEIQPKNAVCQFQDDYLERFDKVYEDVVKRIIKTAKKLNKPVVATGDCHYLDKEDLQFRSIFLKANLVGGGLHRLNNTENIPLMHYRTTDEMLQDFLFLEDPKLIKEIVIDNPKEIARSCEVISIFDKKMNSPHDDFLKLHGVDSVKEELIRIVDKKAQEIYGSDLPEYVLDRLNREKASIIGHNFSPVYYMSYLLVSNSLKEGYLVGSRGSVGSSLVATLMEITEVNPLVPHYRCPKCLFSSFKLNEEERKIYPLRSIEAKLQENLMAVSSGYDLKKTNCPICQTELIGDGHDIPFETFLGFKGDKVPDIDLNFSGDYQDKAHEYVRTILGPNNAYRSGTVSTIQSRTAFGYVKGYLEKINKSLRSTEMERLASHLEGAKRSTGQHPGGIIVVPDYIEIYDITPVQYPADDVNNPWQTTHFDYHSFEDNLLKLDILGHDDPTVIKFLMDYVKAHQEEFSFSDARNIPIADPNIYKLFCGTEVINCDPKRILSDVGSYGVPELGTNFVRNMLVETKPDSFAGLVKISGLSHGTNVWTNNAQVLVKKHPEYGKIAFDEIIGCRDDIMIYLINKGLEPSLAFEIMEYVRKCDIKKPGKKEKWPEYCEKMRERSVPEWYIWSLATIEYLFPKAHATAYILMALRIAWFKVYKPIVFYSAYFSKRASQFDYEAMIKGYDGIYSKIVEIKPNMKSEFINIEEEVKGEYVPQTKTQEDKVTVLLIALEMVERGFSFLPIDINLSHPTDFLIIDNKLLFPFTAVPGLGMNVAENIIEKRAEKAFSSIADIKERTKINKTVFEFLLKLGTFDQFENSAVETVVNEEENNLFNI